MGSMNPFPALLICIFLWIGIATLLPVCVATLQTVRPLLKGKYAFGVIARNVALIAGVLTFFEWLGLLVGGKAEHRTCAIIGIPILCCIPLTKDPFVDWLRLVAELLPLSPRPHLVWPDSLKRTCELESAFQGREHLLEKQKRRIRDLKDKVNEEHLKNRNLTADLLDARNLLTDKGDEIEKLRERNKSTEEYQTQIRDLEDQIKFKDRDIEDLSSDLELEHRDRQNYDALMKKHNEILRENASLKRDKKAALEAAKIPEQMSKELDELRAAHAHMQKENFEGHKAVALLNKILSIFWSLVELAHGHEAWGSAIIVIYALWQKGVYPCELQIDSERLEEMYLSIQLGPDSPFRHKDGLRIPAGRLPQRPQPKTPWSDNPRIKLFPFMEPAEREQAEREQALQNLLQQALQQAPQQVLQQKFVVPYTPAHVVAKDNRVDTPFQTPSIPFQAPATTFPNRSPVNSGGISTGQQTPNFGGQNPVGQSSDGLSILGAASVSKPTVPFTNNPFIKSGTQANGPIFGQTSGFPSNNTAAPSFGTPSGPVAPKAPVSAFCQSLPATSTWGKPSGPAVVKDDAMDMDTDTHPATSGMAVPNGFRPSTATFGNAFGSGFGQQSGPATGFGQRPATAFGQAAPAVTPGFDQRAWPPISGLSQPAQAPGFGQRPPTTAGFGQSAPVPSGFGQSSVPAPGFGQRSPTTSGFGHPTPSVTPGFRLTGLSDLNKRAPVDQPAAPPGMKFMAGLPPIMSSKPMRYSSACAPPDNGAAPAAAGPSAAPTAGPSRGFGTPAGPSAGPTPAKPGTSGISAAEMDALADIMDDDDDL